MEVINDLLQYKDMKIVQDDNIFKFSIDSVLLANFVTINSKFKNILDIGTGNAPIPLILSTRTKSNIVGVEIQPESFSLGKKSVELNSLTHQIELLNMDIKDYYKLTESDTFDVITCNPPYFKVYDNSKVNHSKKKMFARHEMYLDLEDICLISRKLLKNGGFLAMVHRPERLVDICVTMRKYNIEPKRIQLIYAGRNKNANILLIEGRKNGRSGIQILNPICANNEDGSYTEEICKYFGDN